MLLKCYLLCEKFPEPSHAPVQQIYVFLPLRSQLWDAFSIYVLYCNLYCTMDLKTSSYLRRQYCIEVKTLSLLIQPQLPHQ